MSSCSNPLSSFFSRRSTRVFSRFSRCCNFLHISRSCRRRHRNVRPGIGMFSGMCLCLWICERRFIIVEFGCPAPYCQVGIGSRLFLDPSSEEEQLWRSYSHDQTAADPSKKGTPNDGGSAYRITIAYMPSLKQVTYVEQTGHAEEADLRNVKKNAFFFGCVLFLVEPKAPDPSVFSHFSFPLFCL